MKNKNGIKILYRTYSYMIAIHESKDELASFSYRG